MHVLVDVPSSQPRHVRVTAVVVGQPTEGVSFGAVEALENVMELSKHADREAERAVVIKETESVMMEDQDGT